MDFLKQHWIKEVEVRDEIPSTRRSSSAELSDSTEYNNLDDADFDFDCVDDSYLAQQAMDMPTLDFDPTSFIESNDHVNTNAAFYTYGVQNTGLDFDINAFQQH